MEQDKILKASLDLLLRMTSFEPAMRPRIKDIVQSDEFFHLVACIKSSHQEVERLRAKEDPFEYGPAPFETGDLTIRCF